MSEAASPPVSLHRRIAEEIEVKIRSGTWPPGHRLPIEEHLTEQFACARGTVNKALSGLQERGLIERRKRAGTFVSEPQMHAPVLEIPDLKALIEGRGQPYDFTLLLRKVQSGPFRRPDEAALGASGRVLRLNGLHKAAGRPFAFEERLINLAAAPDAEMADFQTAAPGTWLLKEIAWNEAEHRICAVNPDPAVAQALQITPADACLQVKRWTWRAKQGVTFVTQTYPGQAYDLVARFGEPADPDRRPG